MNLFDEVGDEAERVHRPHLNSVFRIESSSHFASIGVNRPCPAARGAASGEDALLPRGTPPLDRLGPPRRAQLDTLCSPRQSARRGLVMTLPKAERRLSAILVADVIGYSHLVERDEQWTLAAIRHLRIDLLEPLVNENCGRLVKLLGDGFIVEFSSVVDAVSSAAKLQRTLAREQKGAPSERRIVLRIGINLGDVIAEDNLLGDGVNVASRLEQLCPPGGVLISGTTYDHLAGKLDTSFVYLGEKNPKNIARPIRAYEMVLDPAPASQAGRGSDKPQPRGRQEAHRGHSQGFLARERISRGQFAFETKLGKSTVDKLLTGLFSDRTLAIVESHTKLVLRSPPAGLPGERPRDIGRPFALKPVVGPRLRCSPSATGRG